MKDNIYIKNEIQSPEAQKVIERLKKLKIVPNNCEVEFLMGSTSLWGLNPCFIGTSNEIITFNNVTGNILAAKKVYPYGTITGYTMEQTVIPKIFLFLGGAQRVEIDTIFSAAGDRLMEFLASKITVNA